MFCPECQGNLTRVFETRRYPKKGSDVYCVQRRRICQDCNHRFNTVELYGDVRLENEDSAQIRLSPDHY